MTFDWGRLIGPGAITLVLGMLLVLMRPLLARLLYSIAETEPGRSADFVFKALDAPGAQDRFRKYSEIAHADRIAEVNDSMETAREALDIAKANSDRLEAVNQSMTAHGAELMKINERVADVPKLSDAIVALRETMRDVSAHMQKTNDFIARMDERERLRAEERRFHQAPNSPLRRATDQSEGR